MDRNALAQKYRNAPNADLFDFCLDKFNQADTNRNGSIEQDEYISLMKDMFKGSDLSDDDIIADFQNGPRDKDGRVTVNEWMDGLMNGGRPVIG